MGRHIFLAVNNSLPILFSQIVIMNEAKYGTTKIDNSVKKIESQDRDFGFFNNFTPK